MKRLSLLALLFLISILASAQSIEFKRMFNAQASFVGELPAGRMTIADFDQDGFQDVVCIGLNGSHLYQNVSGRTFREIPNMPWNHYYASATTTAHVAHLNNDSLPDLVITTHSGSTSSADRRIRIYINQGNFTFQEMSNHGLIPSGYDLKVMIGDFNGDDIDDIYAYNQSGGVSALGKLYINNVGSFTSVYTSNEWHRGVFSEDIDRDGDRDLIIKTQWDTLLFVENTSNGFVELANSPVPLSPDGNAHFGYFTHPDTLMMAIVEGGGAYTQTYFYRLGANMNFSMVGNNVLPTYTSQTRIQVLDVDDDGLSDLYISNEQNGNEKIFINTTPAGDSVPRFDKFRIFGVNTSYAFDIHVPDINNDGQLDIIVGSQYVSIFNSSRIWLGKAAQYQYQLQEAFEIPFYGSNNEAYIEDFDSDGELELLVLGETNIIADHIDTCSFDNIRPTGINETLSFDISTIGDFNGDGNLDVAARYRIASSNYGITLYYNDGTGTFTRDTAAHHNFGTVTNFIRFRGADIDGDGDQDLFLTGTDVGTNSEVAFVYFQGNNGQWTSMACPVNVGLDRVEFFDIDGDNDLDILCEDRDPNDNQYAAMIYRNDGSSWTRIPNSSLKSRPVNGGGAYWFFDLDNDGKTDILQGKNSLEEVRVFTNQGAGLFAYSSFYSNQFTEFPQYLDGLQAADWDNDGDVDVIISHLSGDGVSYYVNNGSGIMAQNPMPSLPAVEGVITALVITDIDDDGDLDIFQQTRNIQGMGYSAVYRNEMINTISIEDFEEGEVFTMQAYPNPTTSTLHVVSPFDGLSTCRVYSISGSLVMETEMEFLDGVAHVDLSQLEGLYVLQVQADGSIYTTKVLVK